MTNRTKLGILTLLLFAAAGTLRVFESSGPLLVAGWMECLRLGIILAAFWLAYPDLSRLPVWIFPALVIVGLAAFRWKLMLLAVPPVLFLGWLLRPRSAVDSRRNS